MDNHVAKKRSVQIDSRQDAGSTADFRVDRVFAPAARPRASSPNLPLPEPRAPMRTSTTTPTVDADLARQLMELRGKFADVQREFDETRELWNAEREMAVEQQRAAREAELAEAQRARDNELADLRVAHENELADLRLANVDELDKLRKAHAEELANQLAELRKAHANELAEVRKAHEADLAAIREGYEAELELGAHHHQTMSGERERMARELADARDAALKEAADREQTYARDAELLAQHHEAELARRDDELAATQRDIVELKVRSAALEEQLARATAAMVSLRDELAGYERENKRLGMERLRFVTHLEEGLALLGAARRVDTLDIEIKRGNDDE